MPTPEDSYPIPQRPRDETQPPGQPQGQEPASPIVHPPFPSTEQTRRDVLPWPLHISPTFTLSHYLEDHIAVPDVSSTSLPPLFSALIRVKPGAKEFLPTLESFLRDKREHELLAQLKGSAAVYVANTLDKVRNHFPAVYREARADFRVVFGSSSVLLPLRILQAHPPPPAVTLRVVGGITYLLWIRARSDTYG